MPLISLFQILAVTKGIQLYGGSYIKWPGVRYSDLLNSSGINLTNSAAATPVYPYIPGTGDPPLMNSANAFVRATNGTQTVNDGANQLLIISNGGNLDGFSGGQIFLSDTEKNYHKTGMVIFKKIK
jgi:hypothetical protein